MHTIWTMRGLLSCLLQASYKLWPPAHIVNFALVPPAYRVLYTNLVSVRPPCLPHCEFRS